MECERTAAGYDKAARVLGVNECIGQVDRATARVTHFSRISDNTQSFHRSIVQYLDPSNTRSINHSLAQSIDANECTDR